MDPWTIMQILKVRNNLHVEKNQDNVYSMYPFMYIRDLDADTGFLCMKFI